MKYWKFKKYSFEVYRLQIELNLLYLFNGLNITDYANYPNTQLYFDKRECQQ
jgi:hypothetical protein